MFGAVSSITVKTPFGPLVGQQSGTVNIFRGVPFAEPPVGPLRYKPTQPLRPWTRPREATQFSPAAMQPGGGGFKESEDCLYLNIWAPSGKGPFPVYIWIHGGGFTGGRAFDPLFDGTALAQQGTVCVTVAYRLGAFGFLDLEPMLGPEFASSANNALRDLIAAFDWVQKSISAFGGDPNQVTIGGESAGAKLTDILMGVPSARSLFHQMISESGGAERVFDIEKSKKVGEGFAKAWHTQTGLSPKALATAPARQIIEVQHNFTANWPWHFPLRCQIDGDLLPHKPVVAIQDGSSKDKRLLIGTNRDESALFVGPHPAHDATPADLGNLTQVQFDKVYKDYENLYPKMSVEMRRIRALTAEEYWVPSMRVAEAHLQGGGEAYVYRLDFAEAAGRLHGFAYHSLDLPLVWDKPHANAGNIADETKLAATMQQAWIEFLRGKAPAAPGLPAWPEYNLETRPTMILNVESQVEHEPQESELNLWKGIL
ncbi:MAG: carboxylesterase/lipase family protein [Acidobacteriota bacterium]|nr:carboxylesterase/lipase family protein [Acidobacteriota bacterium]